MAGHQRSTSWPSVVAHTNEIRIKEALQSISSAISSPSTTIEMVCYSLKRLGDLYICINEVICLNNNQVHGKRLEEEMERSLEVLDLCNTMQEIFAGLKMTIQDLKNVAKKSSSNEDGWLVCLLIAARGITLSALKSAVNLLLKQMATSNASKWSLISKTSRVSCEEVQWQVLELGLAGFGSSVENLFRSLIQTRVSLLNNLSL